MSHRIPWGRVGAEAVVIVVSILLAFGIDAWWAAKEARQKELAYLESLEVEFEQSLSVLEASESYHRMSERSARRLLAVGQGREPWPSGATVDSLLHHAFLNSSTFNGASGIAGVLAAAEGQRLIESLTLRNRLGTWPGLVEENAEDERRIVEYVDERLVPYLLSQAAFGDVFAASGPGMARAYGAFQGSPGRMDHRALLASREFQNYVVMRAALESLVLREHSKLRDAATEILDLIRSVRTGQSLG